jgi:hypothetical protein
VAGSCGAPFPLDFGHGLSLALWRREGRPGNRIGLCGGCPAGAQGRCPSRFPMAFSPLSIGIELQPAGVDQRWVRIWVLDAAARPLVPCRLVARAMAAGRARQLQAAYGAESLWWL